MDIKDNQISLLEENLDCVHMYLDTLNISRTDDKNETYSIVGRIKLLEKRHLKEMSKLESFYLSGNKAIGWI